MSVERNSRFPAMNAFGDLRGQGGGGNRIEFLYTGQAKSEIPRNVTNVRVDPSVKVIGNKAFQDCGRLEGLELCDGLGEIDKCASNKCKYVKRVRIPPTVRKMRGGAFQFCRRLEEPELCEGLGKIGKYAFTGCDSLKHTRIPFTVEKIGQSAFFHCKQLEGLELCKGVREIGRNAFARCDSLKWLRIPSTVKRIGQYAFWQCKRLEYVEICEGVEEIGKYAFDGCIRLKCVRIPSTLNLLSEGAFRYCHKLGKVDLPEGLGHIGEYTFDNCKSLQQIRIPSTARTIGTGAFIDCVQLVSVELNDGLEEIAESAFENCISLRNTSIPSTVKNMGYGALRGCRDIQKLSFKQNMVVNALTCRLDGLQVSQLCYFMNPNQVRASVPTKSRSAQNQDCLGMTPLHILACSTKQNLDLYQLIIASQPKCLITKDKWGCLPIFYAVWGGVPMEIVQFLIDSQKTAFPDIDLNWDMMVSTLCRASASLDVIQMLLGIQQASFPEQRIDLRRVARELTILCLVGCDPACVLFGEWFSSCWEAMMEAFRNSLTCEGIVQSLLEIKQSFFPDQRSINSQAVCEEFVKPLKGWWRRSFNPFQFLVRYSISERLDESRIEKWQMDIKSSVEGIASLTNRCDTTTTTAVTHYDELHSKLIFYECEFRQLKESAFLLELALWKCRISESIATQCNNVGAGSEPDALTAATKRRCRTNSGASIIIPNTLSYLIV